MNSTLELLDGSLLEVHGNFSTSFELDVGIQTLVKVFGCASFSGTLVVHVPSQPTLDVPHEIITYLCFSGNFSQIETDDSCTLAVVDYTDNSLLVTLLENPICGSTTSSTTTGCGSVFCLQGGNLQSLYIGLGVGIPVLILLVGGTLLGYKMKNFIAERQKLNERSSRFSQALAE